MLIWKHQIVSSSVARWDKKWLGTKILAQTDCCNVNGNIAASNSVTVLPQKVLDPLVLLVFFSNTIT